MCVIICIHIRIHIYTHINIYYIIQGITGMKDIKKRTP